MPAKKLKGGREGGNVDVMQCNWPCEVNVLTDDSRHILHNRCTGTGRNRAFEVFDLASLCKRRIGLRRNIDTVDILVNCEKFLFSIAAVSINFLYLNLERKKILKTILR